MTNRGHSKVTKCARCKRRYRGHGEWNFTAEQGYVRELLCPWCQTPEENAEAEIKAATLDYYSDAQARLWGKPKAE